MTNEEAIKWLGIELEQWEADCKSIHPTKDALRVAIEALEKVKKSEETFEWCTDCKEYDKDAHCCHRFSKTLWNTVEEVKDAYNIIFCEECIHYRRWESLSGKEIDWYCNRPNQQSCLLKPNDYCSYGVRKESDEE